MPWYGLGLYGAQQTPHKIAEVLNKKGATQAFYFNYSESRTCELPCVVYFVPDEKTSKKELKKGN